MSSLRRFVLILAVIGMFALALRALLVPAPPTSAPVASGVPAAAPGAGLAGDDVAMAEPGAATGDIGATRAMFSRSADLMLQDGELVNGPAQAGFDSAAFLAERGSALAGYSELARGTEREAGEIVDYVARQHSISPRLLLALLELETGSVDGGGSGYTPTSQATGLFNRLSMSAAWLADGYYGMKYRGTRELDFAGGARQAGPADRGAAHFALARYLARGSSAADLPGRQAAFAEVYARLFDPSPVLDPPIPEAGFRQPPLLLPWEEGQRWHYTGGPHGAWGIATAWGAVDFAPPTMVGCRAAPEWVIAAAPGVVTWSDDGLVLADMDGDGSDATGWVLVYLHMATDGRMPVGTVLAAGDRVGHPSCEGGVADGAHVHFTRRYNGEWLPADGGPAPMNLSGWIFTSYGSEYDGSMAHPSAGTRMAVTSRRPGETEVLSDNGPSRRAELAAVWAAEGGAQQLAQAGDGDGSSGDQAPISNIPTPTDDDNPGMAPAQAELDPNASVTAEPSAPAGMPGTASLTIRLALRGRESQAAAFVIGLERPGVSPAVLMGETDIQGVSAPIALPDSVRGDYTVIVRVPGFTPAEYHGARLGDDHVVIDFTAGGVIALEAGELNHDRAIDPRDLAAWLGLWWRSSPNADLNGDGEPALDDLWPLLRNLRDGGG